MKEEGEGETSENRAKREKRDGFREGASERRQERIGAKDKPEGSLMRSKLLAKDDLMLD